MNEVSEFHKHLIIITMHAVHKGRYTHCDLVAYDL